MKAAAVYLYVYSGETALPAERRCHVDGSLIDVAALSIAVDPDLQRGAIPVQLERVERTQQLPQRVGALERDDDDAKIHYIRVRARTTGDAQRESRGLKTAGQYTAGHRRLYRKLHLKTQNT